MRTLLHHLVVPLLLCTGVAWGQEMGNFKEKHKIDLSGFSKTKFKYTPKDSLSIEKNINIIYDKNGGIISYNKIKEMKSKTERILDKAVFDSLKLKCTYSSINIEVKEDKVFIYPFRYTNNDLANNFFKNNNVYLELEERQNYSFKYRTWQMGVVTIPVKWYVNSKLGNITTDINAMISGGHKWGKTHIVKMPHEKNARQYQRTFSVNALVGISKLTLDESNTIKSDSIKGNVAAISTGLSLGVHYQDFTFLVASGFDFPTSNRKSWQFNNIPWIGLGFGYNFIKSTKASND
ncbi:hypothetical protein ACTS9D_02505 [Empedobacter brevis]